MAFKVTGAFASNLSNFTIKRTSGSEPTGIYEYFKGVAQASYVQAATGNQVADGGTNGAVPATYTAMTTSAQQWYAGPVSANSTGLKGDMVYLLLGVGYDYVGGGNSNLSLTGLTAAYDEA